MKDKNREKQFVSKVKKTLDESTENMDARTLSRLTKARHKALGSGKSSDFQTPQWVPLSAVGLTAAVLVWVVATFQFQRADKLLADMTIEDFQIMTSVDSLDFIENVDFYNWLAEERNNAT